MENVTVRVLETFPEQLHIIARGQANSVATDGQLRPRGVREGIHEFDFLARLPDGPVTMMMGPITANRSLTRPPACAVSAFMRGTTRSPSGCAKFQDTQCDISIRGYTDAKGPPGANLALSEKRAAAVKRWMVKEKAIPEAKLTTEGLGEKDPVAPNKNADESDNPEGRQQNRRVEITVEKLPYAQ